jgi:hypothetical protein
VSKNDMAWAEAFLLAVPAVGALSLAIVGALGFVTCYLVEVMRKH